MSQMKPLLDSELPEDLASVLRSAEVDGPTEHGPAQTRTLAAVAAHRAARANGDGRQASAGLPFAKTMLALAVACAGGAALFSTFGSSATQQAEPTPALASAVSPASRPLESAPSVPPASPSPASPDGVRIDDLPTARVEQPAAKPAAAPPARRGSAEDEIQDELAIIDAARASLAAKRPEATLARVETYRRRFRSGQFNEEADVLEIQALVAMGRRAEAEAKGHRFLAAHPDSAYKRRAQSALGLEMTP